MPSPERSAWPRPRVQTRQPGLLAWLRLARVFQKLQRSTADGLRCWQLSPAQFDVLAQVGMAEGLSQQALADALLVTKGNVCQLLDKMEASGLLERRPEGRVNHLYLTDKGRRLFDQVVPAVEGAIVDQVADALDASEQTRLLRLLRRLDHSLSS